MSTEDAVRSGDPVYTFDDIPADCQEALIAYRDANGRHWKTQLITDWLSDHRRQRGLLRIVRNSYAFDMRALLDSVPRGDQ